MIQPPTLWQLFCLRLGGWEKSLIFPGLWTRWRSKNRQHTCYIRYPHLPFIGIGDNSEAQAKDDLMSTMKWITGAG